MKQHSKSPFAATSALHNDAHDAAPASDRDHREQLIDSALMDTFPASDPIAPGYFN